MYIYQHYYVIYTIMIQTYHGNHFNRTPNKYCKCFRYKDFNENKLLSNVIPKVTVRYILKFIFCNIKPRVSSNICPETKVLFCMGLWKNSWIFFLSFLIITLFSPQNDGTLKEFYVLKLVRQIPCPRSIVQSNSGVYLLSWQTKIWVYWVDFVCCHYQQ